MCKQDEREFLSDFDICNKGESIGNRDENSTISSMYNEYNYKWLRIIDLMLLFLHLLT